MTLREMMRRTLCLLVLMLCCASGCVMANHLQPKPPLFTDDQAAGFGIGRVHGVPLGGAAGVIPGVPGAIPDVRPGTAAAGAPQVRVPGSLPPGSGAPPGVSAVDPGIERGTPGVDKLEKNYNHHPGIDGVPGKVNDTLAKQLGISPGKNLSDPTAKNVGVPGFKNEETPAAGDALPVCPTISKESGIGIGGVPGASGAAGVPCAPPVPGSVPPLPSGPSPTSEEVNGNLSLIVNMTTHPNGTALQSELNPAPKGTATQPVVPPSASQFPHGSKFPGVSGAVPIVHNKPDTPEYPGVPEGALHVGNGSSEAGRIRFSRPVTHATDADPQSNADSSDTTSTQIGENNNRAETTAASSANEVSGAPAQSESIRNTPETPTKVKPPTMPTILQPPMPAKSEDKPPPKKRKADSSSISSSVWVRMPLLIVTVLFPFTVY
ncbi:uncharacterized protein TM35_000741180 [Trypanosoma theileri]|uniref:Mucin-associated surface protein (MASP) n=1 Tax=Trypanosoma theileri TaxID=67003 RepID=A0A1X0NFI4_9TRYP|nr:uncharacterized protein TM35_000741180 [Trypanosoma theileri]ORC83371.1 hypothetical protein TM35_000741180 [Trypanosoma theileri]